MIKPKKTITLRVQTLVDLVTRLAVIEDRLSDMNSKLNQIIAGYVDVPRGAKFNGCENCTAKTEIYGLKKGGE